jgi:predicted ATP-dependent serine protease
LNEALKLGFKRFILPQANRAELKAGSGEFKGLKLVGVDNIKEAIGVALLPG